MNIQTWLKPLEAGQLLSTKIAAKFICWFGLLISLISLAEMKFIQLINNKQTNNKLKRRNWAKDKKT